MFLKVSPHENLMQFGNKGKLGPRYVGPYNIIVIVREAAYNLYFPLSFSQIHNVLHVSSLRKYLASPTHILALEALQIANNLTYQEESVEI